MVSLKIELGKKNVTWVVLLIAVLVVGIVYAYGGSSPSVMGHSIDEISGLGSLATKDSVSWSEISGIPAGFADGVDNKGDCSNLHYITNRHGSSFTCGQWCSKVGLTCVDGWSWDSWLSGCNVQLAGICVCSE